MNNNEQNKKQLSFFEAKDAYKEYVKTGNEIIKNDLLARTSYIVHKFAKEYLRDSNTIYSLEDIEKYTDDYYKRQLSLGRIMKANSFNDLFGEEYKLYMDRSLASKQLEESSTTDLVVTNANVPMIVDKPKQYSLTTKGYVSITVMVVATATICASILLLGMHLVN